MTGILKTYHVKNLVEEAMTNSSVIAWTDIVDIQANPIVKTEPNELVLDFLMDDSSEAQYKITITPI